MNRCLRQVLGCCRVILLLGVAVCRAQSVAPPSLRWEIAAHRYDAAYPRGATQARLRLHNGDAALPPVGWALYFNCASELVLGELPGHLRAEHAGGTLYRIVPADDFPGVPAGGDLLIDVVHPEVVVKASRAPIGPYLVAAEAPHQAVAMKEYRVLPPERAEQMPRGVDGHAFGETAEDRYAANARIAPLTATNFAPVLPTPLRYRYSAGELRFKTRPRVQADPGLSPERTSVSALFARLPRAHGSAPRVRLALDPHLPETSPEAYRLTVTSRGVSLVGKSPAGVARGVASLTQLLRNEPEAAVLPVITLQDAPRFAYRGLHMDVARNFQRKEVVFHVLDLMARHKLNTLHLHLTDDEGWRIEIPGLPELTEVGARRGHAIDPLAMLPPAHGSGPDPADPHGSGFYSAADYIAILRYAADRRITVLPEIEMPGHARAAIIAMQARARRLAPTDAPGAEAFRLNDPQDHSVYVSAQGYSDNVMNPALPSTYRFIAQVIRAVAELHREAGIPLTRIHLGGDELPRGAWTDSPAVTRWMRAEGLPDRAAVWDRFYSTVAGLASESHVEVAGWEEIAARREPTAGTLIPNPALQHYGFHAFVWNNLEGSEDLGLRLANAGFPTVLAPVSAFYFDMVHNPNPEEPGATWAPPVTMQAAFAFDPRDYARRLPGDASHRVSLSENGAAQLQGLEGTLWSETMREPERIDYLLLPRMLALAERAWAAEPTWRAAPNADNPAYALAWSQFTHQVSHVALRALDEAGLNQYRIAAPGLHVQDGFVLANHENPALELRYTTDGTDPSVTSPRYSGPVPLKATVRVAAFDRRGRRGWIAEAAR